MVNMVPDSNISKYDLLRLFNEHMRCSALDVIPDGSLCLDRTLVRTNFDSKFMPASYEEQVVELSAWVREHKGLYPHYRHLPDSGL